MILEKIILFSISYPILIISPGWQSRALHIDCSVENLIAFAFPFFRIDKLDIVMSTFPDKSVKLIFLFANITSRLIIIWLILNC
tara:strand:+ start:9657 stop:9908 length:252 start_codon:yes stop_codon:yes gene_type:complete